MEALNKWMRMLLFLPPQASAMAKEVDALHYIVIGTTMLGSFLTAGVVIGFVVRYRRRGPAQRTVRVAISGPKEVFAALALLSLFLVWWVAGYLQYVRMQTPAEDAMDVYVTAKQWMWKFSHPKGPATAGYLVVPRGRPVRLLLTSRDVIHSFFVPALRIKQDAVPGRYTALGFTADEEGAYQVLCAEFCGTSHSRMWADLVVLDPQHFRTWMNGGTPPLVAEVAASARRGGGRLRGREAADLVAQGQAAAVRYGCLACHTTDGQRHVGPSWQGLYMSEVQLEGGEQVVADEAYLTKSMMEPLEDVVEGYEEVMPTYRGVLPHPEVGALVEFIKSLRDKGKPPTAFLPQTDIVALPEASTRPSFLSPGKARPPFEAQLEPSAPSPETGHAPAKEQKP